MRKHSVLALLGITAALTMALTTTTSARNISIGPEHRFDVKFARLTFANAGAGVSVTCPITLEGSFHSSTVVKRIGLLIGYITGAATNEGACEGGIAHANTETLPWHVSYEGFTGTLPNITGITFLLLRATFESDPAGILPRCRAVTEAAHRVQGIARVNPEGGGVRLIENLRTDETPEIPCREAGGLSLNGSFRGEGPVTVLGTTARLSVRLI